MSETESQKYVNFLRHSGWVGPSDLEETLNIIGCGATGSHIALLAAKMGFHRFRIWDSDLVEPHNLANQAYDVEHVGLYKTDALAAVLKRFNPLVMVEKHNCFFTTEKHQKVVEGPIVLATDSMSSRADIYQTFYMNPNITGVFETRLGFDYGEVNIIDNTNPIKCQAWKSTLVPDNAVPDGPCNLRICTTLVQMVSSYVVHSICSKCAAERQQDGWGYKSKTLFSLTNNLKINNLN